MKIKIKMGEFKMKPILIQGAENSEINYLLQILKNKKEIDINSFKFWRGEIKNYPIIISRTKIGEINATIATAIGIINFMPQIIINQGTAGSHSENIHKGDIVVGEDYVCLTQFQTRSRKIGEGTNVLEWEPRDFSSDDEIISKKANIKLVKIVDNIKQTYTKGNVFFGTIGSGDIWNKEIDRIKFLHNKYGTLCEEMETAAVYHTANTFGVPCIGIRIISNNEILKEEYEAEIATNIQEFVEKVIIELIKNIVTKK